MARRGRKAKHTVKLGWEEIRQSFSWTFKWILACLSRARGLFTVFLPLTRLIGWRNRTYTLDRDGSVTYRPSIWERLATAFRSDATNKRRLLEWAQKHIPKDIRVSNYTTSWSDGITLCALLENLCPGACPRYDLLKTNHKVNNCRLGLKLTQKHFGIPQTIITPEEMSLSATHSEAKMRQLLSLIKWASVQCHEDEDCSSVPGEMVAHTVPVAVTKPVACTVKGSGLLVGIVGKICKFDLFPPVSEMLDILIEVRGPNGMSCSEHITSLFPKTRRNSSASVEGLLARDENVKLARHSTSNLLGHDLPRKEGRQRSTEIDESVKIPFDYQCIGEGQFQMSYVPRSSGQHQVTVKWHDKHIRGSPFAVIVAETLEKLNEECKGIVRARRVTFDNGEIVVSKSNGGGSPADVSVTVQKPSPTTEEPPEVPEMTSGVTAAVLSRSSKVQRSISKSGLNPQKLASQTTITRRRVLRRIITSGGQEIVIHETSETPIGSREGSRDNDSTSSMTDSVGSGERRRSVTKKSTSTTKSFDCEISYDSDVTLKALPTTGNAPIEFLLRKIALEGFIHGIVERIIDNVMKQVHMNNIKKCADESMKIRNKGSKYKLHPRLGARMSLPIPTMTPANTLGPPSFDVRFQCSPYTEVKELPLDTGGKEKVTDKLSLPMELLSPNENKVNGHKKLTVTKSAPMTKDEKLNDKEQNKKNFNKWISSWIDAHCPVIGRPTFSKEFESIPQLKQEDEAPHDSARAQHGTDKDDSGIGLENNETKLTRPSYVKQDSTETGRVTVRTQLRDNKHHGRDSEGQQHKELNTNSGRVCIMDMETSNSPDMKLSKRSMTLPVSTIDEAVLPGDVEESPQSSNIKILQSESMGKSCYYISQRAISGSTASNSQSSGGQEVSLDSQFSSDSVHALRSAVHNSNQRPKLKQTMSKIQLRMSASLPTLSKTWTAFEIDPEDDSLSMEEMEALSVAAQKSKKRMTLGESILSEILAQGIENQDGRESKQMYADLQSIQEERKQYSLGNDLNIPMSTSPNLSVDLNTPQHVSANISPMSSPEQSVRNSRRNSASHKDIIGLQTVNEKESSLEDALIAIQTISTDITNITKTNKQCKLTTVEHSHMGMNIKVPKATIDKWTQVRYEEIKEATGWVKPTTYVRPRPRIVRNAAVEGSSSLDLNVSIPTNGAHPSPSQNGRSAIPRIICQRDEHFTEASNQNPTMDMRNILSPDEEHLQPIRQSTVDSGIADENGGSPKQISPPRTRRLQSIPTSPTAHHPMPPKTSFISGHRTVTRSRYRGKISLDPKLVSGHGSQSNSTSSAEDGNLRRKGGLPIMRYTRSNSDIRKGKRRMPSREESVSDNENRGLRKRQTHRGGCFKRRVTFSRRVLMYRRSSSRNSSKNSRSHEDTVRSPNLSEPSLLEVAEPRADVRAYRHRPKTAKPKLRKKVHSGSKWLSQISRESRESMESGSSGSRYSFGMNESPQASVQHTESLPVAKQRPIIKHRRTASTDLLKDFLSATEVSNPLNVNTPEKIDSFDEFDGYGLSAEGRKSLLEELDSFNKLASGADITCKKTGDASSLQKDRGTDLNTFIHKPECQTPDIVIHSEDSPFSRVILKAEECIPVSPRLSAQGSIEAPPIGSLVENVEADVLENYIHDHIEETNAVCDNVEIPNDIFYDYIPGTPDPFRCQAFGIGLKLGHVGIKNNFQVCTKTTGNGALSVALSGPRPHTVSETNLTYTGDDLYEVFYEVSHPGIYLVNVKWNEYHIQGSPYVCQVTY